MFTGFNYEHFIQRNMSIRIGVGLPAIYSVATPVMFNFFVGNNHKIELGVGAGIDLFLDKNKMSIPSSPSLFDLSFWSASKEKGALINSQSL